jgi:hypothetical protein
LNLVCEPNCRKTGILHNIKENNIINILDNNNLDLFDCLIKIGLSINYFLESKKMYIFEYILNKEQNYIPFILYFINRGIYLDNYFSVEKPIHIVLRLKKLDVILLLIKFGVIIDLTDSLQKYYFNNLSETQKSIIDKFIEY